MSDIAIQINPLGGIAGDMFVAACADLWPDLKDACLADLADAGAPKEVSARFETVSVNGFASTAFTVEVGDAAPASGRYAAIVERLQASALEATVLETALAIFRILGLAEAKAHGKPLEDVHFHELADWDSVIDIVAAASFIARAPQATWTVGPLPLGHGLVNTQHGKVPVPAPAVVNILEGYEFFDDGVGGERVTPTGAAILRHLTAPGDARASGRLMKSGFGAGTKRFEGLANVVQLISYASSAVAADEVITEISFDIDDMTPEELGVAVDRLRATAGVLDVIQTPQIGKKGRAIIGLRVLADREVEAAVADLCLTETSTLGLRITEVRRKILPRAAAATADGAVKVAERPDGRLTAKVESDDLAGTPALSARRAQARIAEAAALGDADD